MGSTSMFLPNLLASAFEPGLPELAQGFYCSFEAFKPLLSNLIHFKLFDAKLVPSLFRGREFGIDAFDQTVGRFHLAPPFIGLTS